MHQEDIYCQMGISCPPPVPPTPPTRTGDLQKVAQKATTFIQPPQSGRAKGPVHSSHSDSGRKAISGNASGRIS